MSGSKPACVKSALSAKELWWSAGCSAVSPTALAPPTVPASTAPIINSPGRKKAKPCRGGYRPSTLRSTGNGSPTVSASSRSFSRCTEFHKRPTATCCRLKKPKKAALNQGIFLPHLDNPGVSGRLRGGNAHNHLIFRGFSRCQKVATPKRFSKSPPLLPIVLTASANVRHAHAFQATVFQDRCSELRISNSASEAGVVGHDRPKPPIRARLVVHKSTQPHHSNSMQCRDQP